MTNITRFIILSRDKNIPIFKRDRGYITSLVFKVKDIPAALYKALGGFATNGINLLKLTRATQWPVQCKLVNFT